MLTAQYNGNFNSLPKGISADDELRRTISRQQWLSMLLSRGSGKLSASQNRINVSRWVGLLPSPLPPRTPPLPQVVPRSLP